MRAPVPPLILLGLVACGSPNPAAQTVPSPAPGAPTAFLQEHPAPDTPAELAQYGRLVGTWRCQSYWALPDGGFEPRTSSTWSFHYALGGRAIQDVWVPDGGGPVGTNLRLFDPATGTWTMVWASAGQPFFDEFTARAENDRVVMHGERRARPAFGAHRARITFHDVTAERFAWRYEAAAPGSDGPWETVQRLDCRRTLD